MIFKYSYKSRVKHAYMSYKRIHLYKLFLSQDWWCVEVNEPLQLKIEAKAKQWIACKGGALTIEMIKAQGCCGGGPMELTTYRGKPKNEQAYMQINVDGLCIYIQRAIPRFTKDRKIYLKLWGLGPLKSVSASGLTRILEE